MKNYKFKFLSFFCLLFLVLSFVTANAQQKQKQTDSKIKKTTIINGVKYYLHTVEKGQTLFAIAKIYDKIVNDIVLDNPETIDGIKPGQVLKIAIEKAKAKEPEKIKEKELAKNDAADSSKYIIHKVESGQTFYSLAKQYATTIEKLKALNPDAVDALKIGQMLKIKEKTKSEKVSTSKQIPAEKVVKVEAEKNTTNHKEEEIEKEKTPVLLYKGKFKDEYQIAYFLPFLANEANTMEVEKLNRGEEQFSNKTTIALQFYEGALIAIDSLKKQKLNAKIYVYDIDDKDSAEIEKIFQKPELEQMDLIVGPLYGSSFNLFAKFAKAHSIPIITPFMQVNKILFNNPYVCKLSPSSVLQVEQMTNYVLDSFQNQNILLVDIGNSKELPFVNAVKNTMFAKGNNSSSDTLPVVKNLSAVQPLLSVTKINVVLLPTNNQSYVTEFVRGLNSSHDKFKIVLCGMPSWINFDNMDFDYLNNLNTHIPANNFVNYDNNATKNFLKKYREQYKSEPEMYSYQGFDATYYFLSCLQKYGTGFLKDMSAINYEGLESRYQFKQFPADSGFENKFVFILQYRDFKLLKAN